jgi:hypothetical protein
MGAKKLLDGVRVPPFGVGGNHGIEKLDEPLAGARREIVDRMTDNVGVNMFAEVKAHRKSVRDGALRVVVGNGRDSGKI